ncbi:Uncharacterised protein g8544 [Pycnogonum litorale]
MSANLFIGGIEKCDWENNTWKAYKICLNSWMSINKIAEEEKVNALLTVIGSHNVELLVNPCTPSEVNSKTFSELIVLLDNHFNIGMNEVSEAYKFDTRRQRNRCYVYYRIEEIVNEL